MNQNQQFQANLQTIKQMAEVLARQERVKSIKKIVAERRIETLCHFTRVENLSSILRKGLLGRSQLVERRIQFEKIDHNRQDGCPEAVCLTISFPNYKLFYTKRNNYGDWHGVDHNQWVVLLLDARLLWELDCAFCKYNAADSSVAGLPLEDRKKTEALESMFGDFPTLNRRWNFPLNFPTSPKRKFWSLTQSRFLTFAKSIFVITTPMKTGQIVTILPTVRPSVSAITISRRERSDKVL